MKNENFTLYALCKNEEKATFFLYALCKEERK